MAPTVHVIDPDYDTVIALKDPSTKFAGEHVIRLPGSGGGTEVHYQVSSRHLQLASPWFKRAMAKDTWSESKLEDGKYQIIAHDWDEQAFLMLLNIFHLRTKRVPRVIPLDLLAKVGVLVDYYECGEAIEMFTAMWIDEVKKIATPSIFCRNLVLWIWIAWIFDLPKHFEDVSAVAIKYGKLDMDTLELPIPASVSSEIDLRRCQAIDLTIVELHKLLDKYRSSSYTCPQDTTLSDLCGSFKLGALTRDLDGWSLLSPRPEIPFDGMSFNELCSKALGTKFRKWQADLSTKSPYNSPAKPSGAKTGGSLHNCSLATDVAAVVNRASAKVVGLSLRHMQGVKMPTAEGPLSHREKDHPAPKRRPIGDGSPSTPQKKMRVSPAYTYRVRNA